MVVVMQVGWRTRRLPGHETFEEADLFFVRPGVGEESGIAVVVRGRCCFGGWRGCLGLGVGSRRGRL
jgi:hypothetical protein